MSEGEKRINGEIYRNIPRRIPCLPKDLLQRFMSKNHLIDDGNSNGEVEIELDLGLSLNGRFGVDPLAKTRLTRSSSIPDFLVNNSVRSSSELEKEGSSCVGYVGPNEGLKRACSLPTETEEEWRKRKEMQSLRRLEAKRKRSEKQRNVRVVREKHKSGGEDKVVEDRREEGSIGSSGSGSSGLSELDILPPVQATNKSVETSPTSAQSIPEKPQGNNTNENPANSGVKEAVQNILEDMPCVSTTGNGPNGKKIDGFLYRYRKGEEVRIVCVCHGSFLSPAEFVKHAGGGDVAHPLKHIVVNPTPFL